MAEALDEHASEEELKAFVLASLDVVRDGECERLLAVDQRDPRTFEATADWIEGKRHRVTASRFAAACEAEGARSTAEEACTQIFQLPEGNRMGASIGFGIVFEDKARNCYTRCCCSPKGLPEVEVREVGLCVCRELSWLAGSPDGICWQDGSPVGLLEIKCARGWNEKFEAAHNGSICNDWLYQMQGGLQVASSALCQRLSWCDLFLWTPGRFQRVRLNADMELWQENMLPKLTTFYFERVMPRLISQERTRRVRARKTRGKHAARRAAKRYEAAAPAVLGTEEVADEPTVAALSVAEVADVEVAAVPDVQTASAARKKMKPNEACSCGSGRKFKKCCGAGV